MHYNKQMRTNGTNRFQGMKIRVLLPPRKKMASVERGYVSLFFHPGFWNVRQSSKAVLTSQLKPYDFLDAGSKVLPDRVETHWFLFFSVRRRLLILSHCCQHIHMWDDVLWAGGAND